MLNDVKFGTATDDHGTCPNCGVDLNDGSIWEHFYKETGSAERADEIAENYGATREHGKFGRQTGLYDYKKDKTVLWLCPDCDHIWPREE